MRGVMLAAVVAVGVVASWRALRRHYEWRNACVMMGWTEDV